MLSGGIKLNVKYRLTAASITLYYLSLREIFIICVNELIYHSKFQQPGLYGASVVPASGRPTTKVFILMMVGN
jgi:hypothetical protein